MLAAFQKSNNKKGQGIVEYALLLAFIVGIAMMLNGANLGGAVKGVFDDLAAVLGGKSENKYAAAFDKYSRMKWDDLTNPETEAERLQADIDGLQKIADWFMGKTEDEVESLLSSAYGVNGWNEIKRGNDGVILSYGDRDQYYKDSDRNYARYYYRNTPVLELLGEGSGTAPNGANSGSWVYTGETRYFFSDEMNSQTNSAEKQVKLNLTFENGVVTSSHVWAEQYKANQHANSKDMSALDVRGKK